MSKAMCDWTRNWCPTAVTNQSLFCCAAVCMQYIEQELSRVPAHVAWRNSKQLWSVVYIPQVCTAACACLHTTRTPIGATVKHQHSTALHLHMQFPSTPHQVAATAAAGRVSHVAQRQH